MRQRRLRQKRHRHKLEFAWLGSLEAAGRLDGRTNSEKMAAIAVMLAVQN